MVCICIVGAGLAGSMMATLLGKLGFEVHVYEKRLEEPNASATDEEASKEFGTSTSALKRSINLALSFRGIKALREANVLDQVMEQGIAMPRRVIHYIQNGTTLFQPYGVGDEKLWSVGRQTVNSILHNAMNHSNVQLHFGYQLEQVDKDGNCTFMSMKNHDLIHKKYDLVIGADGAYSAVRDNLLKLGRIDFSRSYLDHGYKEMSIPPCMKVSEDGQEVLSYALDNHNGLHIWPRGKFMLIALPNPDKSFTATLFAPYKGVDGFDHVNIDNDEEIIKYFTKYFPDVVPLMPALCEDFRLNPVGSLITVRLNPWNYGKLVLLGDAAHAVVPFYGQGMNAAFEDAWIFYDIIRKHLLETSLDSIDLAKCSDEFALLRTPAANALSELCLEHYHDMAANTASLFYLFQKRVESVLSAFLPNTFVTLYRMVSFTDKPYHEAVEKALKQEKAVEYSILGTSFAIGIAGILIWTNHYNGFFRQEK